ncbi:DUF2933 domain-containing protein [Inquilinus sp. Marseille-Q2685]|uniref:DUF2933 domain-containing protein n=1 Tax=Inquilinus sp. Marseille-Q2685 TaxID=2866581 RepID=UPI001CE3FF55|nr:DUF2933 domain-containing protein [Inquilinus sp. Marseille-Q2685]
MDGSFNLPDRSAPAAPSHSSACGGSSGWFGRHRRTVILAAVAVTIGGFALGWGWLGFAAMAPLLYLLPCMAMMAFCMKGMGRHGGEAPGARRDTSGSDPVSPSRT